MPPLEMFGRLVTDQYIVQSWAIVLTTYDYELRSHITSVEVQKLYPTFCYIIYFRQKVSKLHFDSLLFSCLIGYCFFLKYFNIFKLFVVYNSVFERQTYFAIIHIENKEIQLYIFFMVAILKHCPWNGLHVINIVIAVYFLLANEFWKVI